MSLSTLIEVGSHFQEIEAYLDALTHAERVRDLGRLKRRDQRKLFELVEGAEPLTMDFFVPKEVPPFTEVLHYGKNTLPLLPRFRRFQKRFFRDDSGNLGGYNQSPALKLIGPGYFMLEETNSEWKSKGNLVVNYERVPAGDVPPRWPKVIPNTHGLQMFVYHKTTDYMRRVSSHCSIGVAFRGHTHLGNWFVLCREDCLPG